MYDYELIKQLEEQYDAQAIYTDVDLNILTSVNLILFKWVTDDYRSPVYPKWNKQWVIGEKLKTKEVDMDKTNPASYGINLSILSEMEFYRMKILDDIPLVHLVAVLVIRSINNKLCVLEDLSGIRVQECIPIFYLGSSRL